LLLLAQKQAASEMEVMVVKGGLKTVGAILVAGGLALVVLNLGTAGAATLVAGVALVALGR